MHQGRSGGGSQEAGRQSRAVLLHAPARSGLLGRGGRPGGLHPRPLLLLLRLLPRRLLCRLPALERLGNVLQGRRQGRGEGWCFRLQLGAWPRPPSTWVGGAEAPQPPPRAPPPRPPTGEHSARMLCSSKMVCVAALAASASTTTTCGGARRGDAAQGWEPGGDAGRHSAAWDEVRGARWGGGGGLALLATSRSKRIQGSWQDCTRRASCRQGEG